jgi:hypothetical protein
MSVEEITKLKELLQGAKVLEINSSDNPESVFELVVDRNGSKCSVTLFANDLGWWVSGIKKQDGVFLEFQELLEEVFEHYDSHGDYSADSFESTNYPAELNIGFKCRTCGKEFISSLISVKNSEYFDLLTTVVNRKNFAKIISGHYIQDKECALEYLKKLRN